MFRRMWTLTKARAEEKENRFGNRLSSMLHVSPRSFRFAGRSVRWGDWGKVATKRLVKIIIWRAESLSLSVDQVRASAVVESWERQRERSGRNVWSIALRYQYWYYRSYKVSRTSEKQNKRSICGRGKKWTNGYRNSPVAIINFIESLNMREIIYWNACEMQSYNVCLTLPHLP